MYEKEQEWKRRPKDKTGTRLKTEKHGRRRRRLTKDWRGERRMRRVEERRRWGDGRKRGAVSRRRYGGRRRWGEKMRRKGASSRRGAGERRRWRGASDCIAA